MVRVDVGRVPRCRLTEVTEPVVAGPGHVQHAGEDHVVLVVVVRDRPQKARVCTADGLVIREGIAEVAPAVLVDHLALGEHAPRFVALGDDEGADLGLVVVERSLPRRLRGTEDARAEQVGGRRQRPERLLKEGGERRWIRVLRSSEPEHQLVGLLLAPLNLVEIVELTGPEPHAEQTAGRGLEGLGKVLPRPANADGDRTLFVADLEPWLRA